MFPNVDAAIKGLSKLEPELATYFIDNSFEGKQQSLLHDFLANNLTEDEVRKQWDQYDYTGDILRDAKSKDLSFINRLELTQHILTSLAIPSISDCFPAYEETNRDSYVLALAHLIKDLVKDNNLQIKNEEARLELSNQLGKLHNPKTANVIDDILGMPDPAPEEEDEEEFEKVEVTVDDIVL